MKHRILGKTGLHVSEIGLGTVELGLKYGLPGATDSAPPEEVEAARLLNRALDAGVSFIDTARVYGNSEEVIGRAIAGRRSEYILATKVPHFGLENLHGTALRTRVRESLEQSLRALRTDRVDILKIHSAPAGFMEAGEMIGLIDEFKRQGFVGFIGSSVYADSAEAAVDEPRQDCLQVAYSALDRTLEKKVLPKAAERGTGIVIRSVLLKGVLTPRREHLPEPLVELRNAADLLEGMARQAGISLPELAYRYVLANPACHVALVGTSRWSELEETIRFAEAGPLPGDLSMQIRSVAVSNRRQLNPATWPS